MNHKPHALLDEVKVHKGLRSDRQLAELLNVAPPVISKVRAGVLPVGDTLRIKVIRTLGWNISFIDKLAPPQVE